MAIRIHGQTDRQTYRILKHFTTMIERVKKDASFEISTWKHLFRKIMDKVFEINFEVSKNNLLTVNLYSKLPVKQVP